MWLVLICCSVLFICVASCILSDLFFCKQKTAYEMRISDWSSDVCSSDLRAPQGIDIVTPIPRGDAAIVQHDAPIGVEQVPDVERNVEIRQPRGRDRKSVV